MGVMVDKSNKPMSGRNSIYNSGFNGTFGGSTYDNDTSGLTKLATGINFPTDTRYYDTYAYAENEEIYNRRILGDATGEMGPFATVTYGSLKRPISSWYADESYFVYHLNTCFIRGGRMLMGLSSGINTFSVGPGNAASYLSFRVVLSI